MIKEILKKILPNFLVYSIHIKRKKNRIYKAYKYDFKRYWKYSASTGLNEKLKLEGQIIKEYHVIEKGLTMPEIRLGFGETKIILLSDYCKIFIAKYGLSSKQVEHAIGVIKEYKEFHLKHNYTLKDNISNEIESLLTLPLLSQRNVAMSNQIRISKDEYFKNILSPFSDFSNSRSSVRNYTKENISLDVLKSAIGLALNTPSACNRQTARTYIFTDKKQIEEILEIQKGARGFGHLVNKLIVITAELGVFSEAMERNQVFIDGGFFVMNLLYALHSKGIACCTLNCSNTPDKDELLQNACKTRETEAFIAMIACGIPPEEFDIAASLRYNVDDICEIF